MPSALKQNVMRAAGLLLLALVLAAIPLGLERRAARASHTWRREYETLRQAPLIRRLHAPAVPGQQAAALAAALSSRPVDVRRALLSTRLDEGGLPPGLAWATLGPATWESVLEVLESGQTTSSAEACLDGLALGRDAALFGAAAGVLAAGKATRALVPACWARLREGDAAAREVALPALEALRLSVPGVESLVRRTDLDEQLRVMGRWMRPEDVAGLGPEVGAALTEGRVRPEGWLARQSLLGLWTGRTRTAARLAEALTTPGPDAQAAVQRLDAEARQEAAVAAGFTSPYLEAVEAHRRRVQWLALLERAVRWTVAPPGEALDPAALASEGLTVVKGDGQLRLEAAGVAVELPVIP